MQETQIIVVIYLIGLFWAVLTFATIVGIPFLYQNKQLIMTASFEKELLRAKAEVREQFLMETHDNIGQLLTLAKLYINRIELEAEGLPVKLLGDIADLITESLDDIRDLNSSHSRDLIQKVGLKKALDSQIARLDKADCYTIEFDVLGNYSYLEEQKEVFIFRILQEALNNIIHHSSATKIKIVLDYTRLDSISMSIIDNGCGFDAAEYTHTHSIHPGGIRNMIFRTQLIGGRISIQSSSQMETGTIIIIDVPIKQKYGYI